MGKKDKSKEIGKSKSKETKKTKKVTTSRKATSKKSAPAAKMKAESSVKQVEAGFSLLTDFDIHLFREGTHARLYEKMGSHEVEVDGVKGTFFAVWAPNAKKVSVVGNFNHLSFDGALADCLLQGYEMGAINCEFCNASNGHEQNHEPFGILFFGIVIRMLVINITKD